MSETQREWKYLAPRMPPSKYKQLFIKGTRIRAEVIYGMTVDGADPAAWMTAEQIAIDMNVPLEAVREAIAYCQSDPPEVREDHRREELLMAATGMNDRDYKFGGRYKVLSPLERAGLGL